MGESHLPLPTSFSLVTSTDVGINPQNLFDFKVESYLAPVPNYWTWTKKPFTKIGFSGQIL